jgi:TDG/mug DNA glycosylase family protein
MSTIYSFDPLVNKNCRVLILGSMPGKESLRKGQYYGHAQNAFWRLMSALLNEPYFEDYNERLAMLLRHGIALWDVIRSCDRETSLDAHIKNAVVNDFESFFGAYPDIRHVFLNGQKAYNTFARHVGFKFEGITFERLGSTSPAHAIAFEKRLVDWQRILMFLRSAEDDKL